MGQNQGCIGRVVKGQYREKGNTSYLWPEFHFGQSARERLVNHWELGRACSRCYTDAD